MRWLVVVLALWCGGATAAAVPLTLPSNVAKSGTSFVTSAGAAFSGAAFNSALRTQVAGKLVTVPAAWRLASNAGQIAAAAVRLNPAGLVTTAVAAWAIAYGLQWLDGQWVKRDDQTDGWGWWSSLLGQSQLFASVNAACEAGVGWRNSNIPAQNRPVTYTVSQTSALEFSCAFTGPNNYFSWDTVKRAEKCLNGSFPVNGVCPGGVPRPATDADWEKLAQSPLSDAAASSLSAGKVALPLSPQVDPATQVVPLSDPYIDPVTGKRFRDVAHVTPSATDPQVADLQVTKQEVDANGDPAVDPDTGTVVPPRETDDPCLAHPNRVGCMDAGQPENPDLPTKEKTISITPDTGWGADSAACPADIQVSYLGKPLAWSFKPVCDGADMFRPLVIGMAWVAAVLIALGVGRKGD